MYFLLTCIECFIEGAKGLCFFNPVTSAALDTLNETFYILFPCTQSAVSTLCVGDTMRGEPNYVSLFWLRSSSSTIALSLKIISHLLFNQTFGLTTLWRVSITILS